MTGSAGASPEPPAVGAPDGPWLVCPYCSGQVPLAHLASSDDEPGAVVAVCGGCGRRVAFVAPS